MTGKINMTFRMYWYCISDIKIEIINVKYIVEKDDELESKNNKNRFDVNLQLVKERFAEYLCDYIGRI